MYINNLIRLFKFYYLNKLIRHKFQGFVLSLCVVSWNMLLEMRSSCLFLVQTHYYEW